MRVTKTVSSASGAIFFIDLFFSLPELYDENLFLATVYISLLFLRRFLVEPALVFLAETGRSEEERLLEDVSSVKVEVLSRRFCGET